MHTHNRNKGREEFTNFGPILLTDFGNLVCLELLFAHTTQFLHTPSGDYALMSWIFVEWPGGVLLWFRDLRIPDLKFLSTLFWLDLMGLASRAGSVALQTSFGGKGPHLKQWLVTLLSAPNSFLTEVFLSHKANVRKSVALSLVSPPFHYRPHHFPISDWLNDWRDRRNWPGESGEPVASA